MDLTTTNYIEPYPKKALGGELGLTSIDIARALGVRHDYVYDKIRRNQSFYNSGGLWRIAYFTHILENNRKSKAFQVSTIVAKYVVATWKNDMGRSYFDYLEKCENFVQKEVPKLQALIETLTNKFVKPRKINGYIIVPKIVKNTDIFGEEHYDLLDVRILMSQATKEDLEQYKFIQRQRTMNGLHKKQTESLNNGTIKPMPSKNLLT